MTVDNKHQTPSVKDVKEAIDKAFHDVTPPSDGIYVPRDEVDFPSDDYELVQERFSGVDRTLVDLKWIKDNFEWSGDICLICMNEDAFHYYFPSFMKIALDDYIEADVVGSVAIFCCNMSLRKLNSTLGKEHEQLAAIRFKNFTPSQIDATVQFLDYMSRTYGEFDAGAGEASKSFLDWAEERGLR